MPEFSPHPSDKPETNQVTDVGDQAPALDRSLFVVRPEPPVLRNPADGILRMIRPPEGRRGNVDSSTPKPERVEMGSSGDLNRAHQDQQPPRVDMTSTEFFKGDYPGSVKAQHNEGKAAGQYNPGAADAEFGGSGSPWKGAFYDEVDNGPGFDSADNAPWRDAFSGSDNPGGNQGGNRGVTYPGDMNVTGEAVSNTTSGDTAPAGSGMGPHGSDGRNTGIYVGGNLNVADGVVSDGQDVASGTGEWPTDENGATFVTPGIVVAGEVHISEKPDTATDNGTPESSDQPQPGDIQPDTGYYDPETNTFVLTDDPLKFSLMSSVDIEAAATLPMTCLKQLK
jgi:hypothetical protein